MSDDAQPSELEKRVFTQLTAALGRELEHRLVLGRAPRKNKHAAAELSPKALQLLLLERSSCLEVKQGKGA